MQVPFFHRLYVRIWLAVVLAVFVLTLLVGWLIRVQSDRLRAERLAEVPAREATIRNAQGDVIGSTLVKPVRVPGRGVEFHIQLPANVRGGEQMAISLPQRPRPEATGQGAGSGDERMAGPRVGPGAMRPPAPRAEAWWSRANAGAFSPFGLAALLAAFAGAIALASYPVIRRLTKRLESLQKGVERLGSGDLRVRVDESGEDEAAYLARRFNRAADQIEALVQAQKSLLANASHELRSPLARIRMGLELMESHPSANLKLEVARSISELDALIDEILLASRIEAQATASTTLRKEELDLLALAAEEAARAGLELKWDGQPALASIRGDSKLLRRMIRNLLENAKRYGAGEISLSLSLQPDGVQIEVADRGSGVRPEERERIFEPFYRSQHAGEHHGGVGLGLALVRAIARQHGGEVTCTDREGGGARFLVHLPKLAQA